MDGRAGGPNKEAVGRVMLIENREFEIGDLSIHTVCVNGIPIIHIPDAPAVPGA
jgi:hypothetical protein